MGLRPTSRELVQSFKLPCRYGQHPERYSCTVPSLTHISVHLWACPYDTIFHALSLRVVHAGPYGPQPCVTVANGSSAYVHTRITVIVASFYRTRDISRHEQPRIPSRPVILSVAHETAHEPDRWGSPMLHAYCRGTDIQSVISDGSADRTDGRAFQSGRNIDLARPSFWAVGQW